MLTMRQDDYGLPLDVGRPLLLQRLRDPFRRQPEDKLPHDLVVNADIFVEDRHFSPVVSQAVPGLRNDVALDAQYLDVAKVFVF